jgi:hypothetical protein
MSSSPTSLLAPLIRVLISAWIIYQVFEQERTLEPKVRVVRWGIVLAGVATFFLALAYLPGVPIVVLIGFVTLPTGLVFLFPELTVYIVRGYRVAARRLRGSAEKKGRIESG